MCIHVRKKREKKDVCEETSEIYDYTFVITQDQLLHTFSHIQLRDLVYL